MSKRLLRFVAGLLCGIAMLIAVTGCEPEAASAPTEEPTPVEGEPAPSATPSPVPPTATPTPTPTASGPAPLPPEPQPVEFQAEDGQVLQGLYYPAAVNPGPVVVLMHWVGGDQHDWDAIAPWLQNRGLVYTPAAGAPTWLDPSWFPPMPEGRSYAVFTFNFRGCEGGCSGFDPAGWRLDARAAVTTAMALEGVDPERVSAMGASIGADGAVDGCETGCVGVFSLSPGGYLGVPYADAVTLVESGWVTDYPIMDSFVYPLECLAAEEDADSAQACRSASGEHYQTTIYPGGAHGMVLLQPGLEPDIMQMILEWLLE